MDVPNYICGFSKTNPDITDLIPNNYWEFDFLSREHNSSSWGKILALDLRNLEENKMFLYEEFDRNRMPEFSPWLQHREQISESAT